MAKIELEQIQDELRNAEYDSSIRTICNKAIDSISDDDLRKECKKQLNKCIGHPRVFSSTKESKKEWEEKRKSALEWVEWLGNNIN